VQNFPHESAIIESRIGYPGGIAMKMKLFRYGYLIRHAIDLGRIFPIIIKQRGVSKIIMGISSRSIEIQNSLWIEILESVHKVCSVLSGWVAGRIFELTMNLSGSIY
jgi:hypothetical protein